MESKPTNRTGSENEMNAMMRICGFLALVSAASTLPAGDPIDWPDIDGAIQPAPQWLVAGQPRPHELVALQRAGVRHIVNARGEDELDAWDEPALAASLDMKYHAIPVADAGDLNRNTVEKFDAILARIGESPAMLHCASGNRIGALFALRAGWLQGEDPGTAVEIGRAHGLTGLEARVRDLLDQR